MSNTNPSDNQPSYDPHMQDGMDGLSAFREIVEEHVRAAAQWYQDHKGAPRRLYRLSTVLGIVVGATIPMFSLLDAPGARLMAAIGGIVVTAVAALNAAYRWDKTWQVFTLAQTQLEAQLAEWELRMLIAESAPTREQREKAGASATRELLIASRSIRESEAEEFFRSIAQRAESKTTA
jgi:Protein of unknown function (DUF4231)